MKNVLRQTPELWCNCSRRWSWFILPTQDVTLQHLPFSRDPPRSTRGRFTSNVNGREKKTPASAASLSDLSPLALYWLHMSRSVDQKWRQCLEGTADETWGHSAKGVTWKCWCLTVHVLSSFLEICQHIHYIWIQTELNDRRYVISRPTATPFKVSASLAELFHLHPCIINGVFTHLERLL